MSYHISAAVKEEKKIELYGEEVPVVVSLALRGSEEARLLLAGLSERQEWVVCCVRPPKVGEEDPCYQRLDCQLRWEREDGTFDYGPSFLDRPKTRWRV